MGEANALGLGLGITIGLLGFVVSGIMVLRMALTMFLMWMKYPAEFQLMEPGVYIINGFRTRVNERSPRPVRELHARWIDKLVDLDRRMREPVGAYDALGLWAEAVRVENEMRKELVYFDRVCCLDVPDLVKAKVWACL